EVVQNLPPANAIDLAQPNYRRVVADNVRAIIPNVASVGDLEISGVRLVDHLKGPAWLTCLKVDAHGKPQNYALFIQGDKIIDSRVGIVIDQCYKQTFEPFDLSPPPTRKRSALDFDLFDGFIGLDLAPDRAPEWHAIAKAYLAEPGLLHQHLDLGLRHTMFE